MVVVVGVVVVVVTTGREATVVNAVIDRERLLFDVSSGCLEGYEGWRVSI